VRLYAARSDQEAVRAVVDGKLREDEHLDFKGAFWADHTEKNKLAREEAAKDVAAFMNHLGGTILVGVSEDSDSRASGFNPKFKLRGKREQLLDWLKSHLAPAEAVRAVGVEEFTVGTPRGDREVLVLNIDPWPHGPVGVRVADRESYRFYVRRDRETRWLSWEEIMRRNDASRRVTYLRAVKMMDAGQPDVRLASPVVVGGHQDYTVTVSVAGKAPHGRLVDVGPDALTFAMTCSSQAAQDGVAAMSLRAMVASAPTPVDKVGEQFRFMQDLKDEAKQSVGDAERHLQVPLDLVVSMWAETGPSGVLVHMVLAGDVVWRNPVGSSRPGRTEGVRAH
jgi:hypothetical protein